MKQNDQARRTAESDSEREMMANNNKSLEYYLSLLYPIVLIPDEDGFWFAEVPLLKGCMTQGSNREEALEMLDEAKRLWLEVSLERGHEIPEPEPVHHRS